MSDTPDKTALQALEEVEGFNEQFETRSMLDKLQKDTRDKQIILQSRKVAHQFEKMEQNEKDLEVIKATRFDVMSPSQIKRIVSENREYIQAAKEGLLFINNAFHVLVPFFRKNLLLLGAKTGDGKSTTVANIVFSIIAAKDSQGKPLNKRAMIITNEERAEDFYNRLTCLANGWAYVNHNKFRDDQIAAFEKWIPLWAKKVSVIDDNHNGVKGSTTTLEGIKYIFESLIEHGDHYDAVIIDYYQKVKESKDMPELGINEVQAKLADMLDNYKNIYTAPIVLMAQVTPPDKEGTPFEFRIKGRKIITDAATFIMEIVAKRDELKTEWIVWKSRFTEAVGKRIDTGYDAGRYVEYDEAFQAKTAAYVERKKLEALTKQNAIKG